LKNIVITRHESAFSVASVTNTQKLEGQTRIVHTQDLTLCLGEATFLPVVEKKEKRNTCTTIRTDHYRAIRGHDNNGIGSPPIGEFIS